MADALSSFWRVVVCVLFLYLVLSVGAHLFVLRMIFLRPPVTYSLTRDYIQLTAPDGVKVIARHWPNPAAKHTLLYLHGNYEDLGNLEGVVPQFVAAGYAVMALDYRQYGHSGGTPTEANTVADALLAFDHLRSQIGVPAEQIVVFGYSVGGGPAVEVARQRTVAGLILQSAFVSAYRVMTRLPLIPGDKFVNIAKVPHLRCPVLVIHGRSDPIIPFWHGEKLYEEVTARKAKLFVEGGDHSGLAALAGPRYWAELKRFTDSL